jgi:beta-glucosidase
VNWDTVAEYASDPENYISGAGVEHFERHEEDFMLLKKLNMNAFRFGIEWSRLEPQEGVWDETAVQHYHDYIAKLRKQHIEPILTIWHWTMPVWFADKGGFAKKQNLAHFERYVTKIAEEFGNELTYILVLNEPNVYALISYIAGFWPPQQKNILTGVRVYRNLASAHRRSYKILKQANKDLQVGIAMNLAKSHATNPQNPVNQAGIWLRDYIWNWWFLNRIRKQLNFIGINFYTTNCLNWRFQLKNPKTPSNDLGWYMKPDDLYSVLVKTDRRYKLPLIVTENGLADAEDKDRKWWIQETITAMQRALTDGVRLTGYLHWSLLDNFEWAYGWWPKFGLVAVDRKTMKRTIRKSALWFGEEIKRQRNEELESSDR